MSLAAAVYSCLQLRANRLETPKAHQLVSKFATAIEAVVVLSGIAFVAVITAIMFGFFVPWLVAVMPHAVRPYLRNL